MDRPRESRLLDFCSKQRGSFDRQAWDRFTDVSPLDLAATARFLAGVSWYGHSDLLAEVANRLSPEGFSDLARKTGFDPGRFSALLKARLKRAGHRDVP